MLTTFCLTSKHVYPSSDGNGIVGLDYMIKKKGGGDLSYKPFSIQFEERCNPIKGHYFDPQFSEFTQFCTSHDIFKNQMLHQNPVIFVV